MKLQKGAKIYTLDGQELGGLSRFVMDPRTKNVTNIVFQRGILSHEEYILPMRLVDHVDEAGIHLQSLPVEHIEDLPKFLQEEFVIADEHALLQENYSGDDAIDAYFHYPSVEMQSSNAFYPNDPYFYNPSGGSPVGQAPAVGVPITGTGDEPAIIRKTEENIPEGTVSLKEGSKVYSNDGKHIGSIERLFVDNNSGRATHLIISKGLLLKERKQIPVDWIDKIIADEVYLAVNAPFTDRLPDYQEK